MIAIIVAIDQLIWRPVIVWSNKFKFEQVESSAHVSSPLLHLLQHSRALDTLRLHTITPISEGLYRRLANDQKEKDAQKNVQSSEQDLRQGILVTWLRQIVLFIGGVVVLYAAWRALVLLQEVHGSQFLGILKGAAATFLRVNISLILAAAWTIPAGVAIGFHPRLARIAQPIAQIAASVPATALFPVILLALVRLGGGMGIGSIALMMLGTQWYILFNVIAGAMAIPNDLKEVATLFHFTTWQRWQTVILPGIFPFLITGMVTASGGAWNASIIAEYFRLKSQTLQTVGLGATISAATDSGQFQILLLATMVMATMVVTINRLLWRPLYNLAETKYKLGG